MPTLLTTRKKRFLFAWLVATLLVAAAAPVGAGGPNGNNGTVKIHSGDAFADPAQEPSPEIKNEPHVSCPFHAHFFFADVDQEGDWWITGHAPTKDNVGWPTGAPVDHDSYDTGDSTSYTTETIELAAGHYKLYWEGRNDKNIKHKTFWVDDGCEGPPPPPDECPVFGDLPPCDGIPDQG